MNGPTPCSFASDLRAFEAGQIEADHAADAREAAELELLRGEYNPSTPANFAEALHEIFASETAERHAAAILDLMREDPAMIGHYLMGMSSGHWQSLAAWKAGKAH